MTMTWCFDLPGAFTLCKGADELTRQSPEYSGQSSMNTFKILSHFFRDLPSIRLIIVMYILFGPDKCFNERNISFSFNDHVFTFYYSIYKLTKLTYFKLTLVLLKIPRCRSHVIRKLLCRCICMVSKYAEKIH